MSCKNPDNQKLKNACAKSAEVVKDWLQFGGVLAKASVEGVVEFWGKEKPAEPAPVVIAPIVSEETAMALVSEPLECENECLNDKDIKQEKKDLKQEKKELKRAKKAEKKEAKLLKKQENNLKKAEKKQASQLKKAEKKKADQLKKEEKKQDDLLKKEEKKQEDLQRKEEKKQDNLLVKEEKKQEKAERKRAKADPVEEPVREEPVEKKPKRVRRRGKYVSKSRILSTQEKAFARGLRTAVGPLHIVKVRVPLASVLRHDDGSKCKGEDLGDMDFGVFDLGNRLRVLIEVKGIKRQNKQSPARYRKVRRLCRKTGIPVVTFWARNGVLPDYFRERIREYLRIL